MKNQISVFEFGDEFNCTDFFDSSLNYGGVDVSRDGIHLGQIIGLSVPYIDDEEETEKFNSEVINWIVDNDF